MLSLRKKRINERESVNFDGFIQTSLKSFFSTHKSIKYFNKGKNLEEMANVNLSCNRVLQFKSENKVKIETTVKEGNEKFDNKVNIKLSIKTPSEINDKYMKENSSTNNKVNLSSSPKTVKISPKKEKSSSSEKLNLSFEKEIVHRNYYLKKIVQNVIGQSRFCNLFSGSEEAQIHEFLNMPPLNQFFCCKLLTRKPIWYNIFKLAEKLNLQKTEEELTKMHQELKNTNFIITDYSSESVSFLLENMSKEDILQICKSYKITCKSSKKDELIAKLIYFVNHQPAIFSSNKSFDYALKKKIKEKIGICVKINENFQNLVSKFYILYFLTDNSCTNISEWNFLLHRIDREEVTFPVFQVDEDISIFKNRYEFLRYEESYLLKQAAVVAATEKNISLLLDLCFTASQRLDELLNACDTDDDDVDRPPHLKRFSAGYVYTSILSSNVEQILSKNYVETFQFLQCLLGQKKYKQSKRGFWYDKVAWIEWKYLKNHECAMNTLVSALKDESISEVARHELSEKGRIFIKSKTAKLFTSTCDKISSILVEPPDCIPFSEVVIDAVSQRENESGRKRKYIERSEDGEKSYLSVEDIAINHYKKIGFPNVEKCEGRILTSLYFLSFWDIIFDSSIKGVFISKMQRFPLDFYSEKFYENRKDKIDQRLNDLEKNWSEKEMNDFLMSIAENNSTNVYIDFVEDSSDLGKIICCIGRSQFAQICKRFIQKFYLFHSGMPDLFMWSLETGKVKFVEVKGEGDRLSTKQKLWLSFFRSINVDAEVCHVHSTGSRGGKKYKKNNSSIATENK